MPRATRVRVWLARIGYRARGNDPIRAVPLWFRLAVLAEAFGLAVVWVADDAAPARLGRWLAPSSMWEVPCAYLFALFVALIPAVGQVALVAVWIHYKERRKRVPEARIHRD